MHNRHKEHKFFHSITNESNLAESELACELTRAVMDADARADNGSFQRVLEKLKYLSPSNCIALKKGFVRNKTDDAHTEASALEYAAWTGDLHLVDLLLSTISIEYTQQALEQLINVRKHGIEGIQMMDAIQVAIQSYEDYETNKRKPLPEYISQIIEIAGYDSYFTDRFQSWIDYWNQYERINAEAFVNQRQTGWHATRTDFESQALGYACSIKGGNFQDAYAAMKGLYELSTSLLDDRINNLQQKLSATANLKIN